MTSDKRSSRFNWHAVPNSKPPRFQYRDSANPSRVVAGIEIVRTPNGFVSRWWAVSRSKRAGLRFSGETARVYDAKRLARRVVFSGSPAFGA